MHKSRKIWFVLALSVVYVSGVVPTTAQKLPVPGKENPDWVLRELSKPEQHEIFSRTTYDSVRRTMPIMKVYGDVKNPETGELISFMDPTQELWYDISKGVVFDFRDGKTYQFYKKSTKSKAPIPTP